jgi:hypothetical protein
MPPKPVSRSVEKRITAQTTKRCPNCKGTGKGLRTVFDTLNPCLLCSGTGRVSLKFTPPKTDDRKQGYWLMHAQLIRGHKPAVLKGAEKEFWKQELTPTSIFLEENVAVRVAKIYCFGVEEFLKAGKVKYLHSEAGYDLISLQLLDSQSIVALKMTCPSTGTVYFIPVPPYMETVPDALDFYFRIPNYLGRVGSQT